MPDLTDEARELSEATGYGLGACVTAIVQRRANNGERLAEWLSDCGDAASVAHAGDHVGIPDAMAEPYPSDGEVWEHFSGLTAVDQEAALTDLEGCPW